MGVQQSNSKSIVSGLDSQINHALIHFQKRFIVSPHPLDPTQSNLFLLHERLSQKKFLLRIINTNDQEDSNKLQSLVCKKLANKPLDSQLIGIDHYMIQNQKSYCNESYHCYLLFKIHQNLSLEQWITYNKGTQQINNQNTMINGLKSLVQGVAWLKYYNQAHPNINLNSVFIDKQTKQFALGDPWMVIGDMQPQYPSPQKLRKMNSQIQNFDPFLENIFSIGIIGLHILGFKQIQKLYRRNYRIDNQRLSNYINSIKSQNLKTLISKLLGTPEQRQQLLRQQKNSKNARNKVKNLVPKQLSGKMANIRKSFVSQYSQVVSPKTITSQLPIKTINNRVFSNHTNPNNTNILPHLNQVQNQKYQPQKQQQQQQQIKIGNFKPMNQNIIVPTDSNDKPTIEDDPLQYLRNNSLNNIKQQTPNPNKNPNTNTNCSVNIKSHPHPNVNTINTYNNVKNKTNITTPTPPKCYYVSKNHENANNILINRNHQPIVYQAQNQHIKSTSNNKISNPNQPIIHQHNSQSTFHKGDKRTNYVIEKIPQYNSTPNILISSPPSLDKGQIKISPNKVKNSNSNTPTMMKEEEEIGKPIGTNYSYRSSESFIQDHSYKSQIQNELKQLQKKVSEVINNSYSISEIEIHKQSPSYADSILINEKKSQIIQRNGYFIESNKASQNLQKKQQKISQKLDNLEIINENQQIKIIKVQEDKKSDLELSYSPKNKHTFGQIEDSLDYIDINNTPKVQNQKSQKKNQENIQQKSNQQNSNYIQKQLRAQQNWQHPIIPSRSIKNLQELGNLTIPQQSDQQSLNASQRRPLGQYVEETYENGGKYCGYIFKGKRNGEGVFYYKDGGYYDGNWKNNMMNGYGKLYYDNGKVAYEGQWYRDEFHGRGKVYNDSPQSAQQEIDYKDLSDTEYYWVFYEGDLVHDMKIGYGRMMFSNGQFYQGEYKNDIIHGKGQYHKGNGTIIKGLWQQGLLVKQL